MAKIYAVKMVSEEDLTVIVDFIETMQNIWPDFPYSVGIRSERGRSWVRILDRYGEDTDEIALFI